MHAVVSTGRVGALASPDLNVITGAARRARVTNLVVGSLLALVGTALFVFATRGGLGFSPDSVIYADGARSIASGHGYTRIVGETGREGIGTFPPLYSAALAALDFVGLGVATGARALNGLLFVVTTLLLFVLVARLTSSQVVAALSAGAFLLAPAVLGLQGNLLSEGLFLFLLVSFLLILDVYVGRSSYSIVIVLGLVAALAALTRYVGIALIVSGIITLLLVGGHDRRQRWRATALFSGVAVAPPAAWLVRNREADTDSFQRFDVHVVPLEQVKRGFGVVSDWFFPAPIPAALRIVAFVPLVAAGAIAFLALVRRARGSRWRDRVVTENGLLVALAVFILSYGMAVALSASFLDADVNFSGRHLSPIFVATVVAVPVIAVRVTRRRLLLRRYLGVWFVVVLALFAYRCADDVLFPPIRETGLTGRFFSESTLMDIVERTPRTTVIYSNVPEAVHINTGRRDARFLPFKVDPHTLDENPRFEAEVRTMAETMAAGHGIVLYWDARSNRRFIPSRAELVSLLRELRPQALADGGLITREGVVFTAAGGRAG
jgi:multisubunit Na+/H+ antiporter MnhF subunit